MLSLSLLFLSSMKKKVGAGRLCFVVLRQNLAGLAMPELKFGAFLLCQASSGITYMYFHMELRENM